MPEERMPLFPMHLVMFPGMVLPLRIEERWQRAMMEDCEKDDRPFGAALIRAVRGKGELIPHPIGCVAEIARMEKSDDDSLHVIAVGQSRFRLIAIEQHAPYLTGRVEILDRDRAEPMDSESLISETWRLFERHMELLFAAASRNPPELQMPQDPELLSFLMAANVRMFPEMKQELLQAESTQGRIESLREMLKVENDTLKAILATAGPMVSPEEESDPSEDE